MSRRRLKDEERELWRQVTRSVTPLQPATPAPPPAAKPAPAKDSAVSVKAVEAAQDRPAVPTSAKENTKGAAKTPGRAGPSAIDRRTQRRIARGGLAIDARIDLHGMSQEEAHAALARFLETSIAARRRLVLVITGKGREGGGVLRRAVPHWLSSRPFAGAIVGFGAASPAHGGDGALYVRLRTSERGGRV